MFLFDLAVYFVQLFTVSVCKQLHLQFMRYIVQKVLQYTRTNCDLSIKT